MGEATDLTGRELGRLTVLRRHGSRRTTGGKSIPLWWCRCACGTERPFASLQLLRRKSPTRSCGCMGREKAVQNLRQSRNHNVGDLTGREFGRLTVEGPAAPTTNGRLRWHCRCSCGGNSTVTTSNLLRPEGIRSCGCAQREAASRSGRAACTKSHRRDCLHCGASFDGTAKQKYCARQCRESAKKLDRTALRCVFCAGPIAATVGAPPRYCSPHCKRRAASAREGGLAQASLAEQMRRKLDE